MSARARVCVCGGGGHERMRAGSIEMEKKERGGGGREVSKLVFYARSTGTLTSGRWGRGRGGGLQC